MMFHLAILWDLLNQSTYITDLNDIKYDIKYKQELLPFQFKS